MKAKRKKTFKSNKFIIVIIFILTLSVGYSFFSSTLYITGSATANYVISGNAIPLNVQLNNSSGAVYSYGTFPTSVATFASETLDGNYLYLYFDKYRTSNTNYLCTFTINFNNPYPYSLSSGSVSTTKLSGGNEVTISSSRLANTTMTPYQTGNKLTFKVYIKNKKSATVVQVQSRISFKVNGITQYFYYIIEVS